MTSHHPPARCQPARSVITTHTRLLIQPRRATCPSFPQHARAVQPTHRHGHPCHSTTSTPTGGHAATCSHACTDRCEQKKRALCHHDTRPHTVTRSAFAIVRAAVPLAGGRGGEQNQLRQAFHAARKRPSRSSKSSRPNGNRPSVHGVNDFRCVTAPPPRHHSQSAIALPHTCPQCPQLLPPPPCSHRGAHRTRA